MKDIVYVTLAKQAIAAEFSGKKIRIPDYKELKEKRGVFVTLTKHRELRGCIGFPYPSYQLGEAITLAAKSAAFSDPRFPPINEKEFLEIKAEVSVLSVPEPGEANPDKIKIGRDGLMCEYEGLGGLLLPQVAVENGWDGEEFLRQLCYKAGLNPDAWREEGFKLWKFTARIINEENLEAG
jgi:hypothetical protein